MHRRLHDTFTDLEIINQTQGHRIIILSFMRVKDESLIIYCTFVMHKRCSKCVKLDNWLLNLTKMNSEGKAFIHVLIYKDCFGFAWLSIKLKWKCLAWFYSTPFSQYKGCNCMWKCTIIFYVQFVIAKKIP